MKRLVVLAAVGIVAGCGQAEAPSVPVKSPAESRADAVMACGLAMLEAEKQGLVSKSSQLQVPWRVYEMPSEKSGVRRVSCAAGDAKGELGVVVDIVCTDVNDSACHPLIKIARP
jgi:hypothetical protein